MSKHGKTRKNSGFSRVSKSGIIPTLGQILETCMFYLPFLDHFSGHKTVFFDTFLLISVFSSVLLKVQVNRGFNVSPGG